MANRTFRTDPINALGLQAKEAESVALQISLQQPATYFRMRSQLLQQLVNQQAQDLYTMVYNVLNDGTDRNGNHLLTIPQAFRRQGAPADFEPRIPEQEINKIALSITKAFKDTIEDQLVDRILPKDLYKIAVDRTVARTANDLRSAGVGTRMA